MKNTEDKLIKEMIEGIIRIVDEDIANSIFGDELEDAESAAETIKELVEYTKNFVKDKAV